MSRPKKLRCCLGYIFNNSFAVATAGHGDGGGGERRRGVQRDLGPLPARHLLHWPAARPQPRRPHPARRGGRARCLYLFFGERGLLAVLATATSLKNKIKNFIYQLNFLHLEVEIH